MPYISENNACQHDHIETVCPPSFPGRRGNGDSDGNAFLIPYPVIVRASESQCIGPARKVCVFSISSDSDMIPFCVKSFQHIGMSVFFRQGVVERGKFKFKEILLPCQVHLSYTLNCHAEIRFFVSLSEGCQHNRRNIWIILYLFRIKTVNSTEAGKPHFPVSCFQRARCVVTEFITLQSVFFSIDFNHGFFFRIKLQQAGIRA